MNLYTAKEVKNSMLSIDANKSPGPDRYGRGFYKKTWNIVGKDISEAVLEFFANEKLLQ